MTAKRWHGSRKLTTVRLHCIIDVSIQLQLKPKLARLTTEITLPQLQRLIIWMFVAKKGWSLLCSLLFCLFPFLKTSSFWMFKNFYERKTSRCCCCCWHLGDQNNDGQTLLEWAQNFSFPDKTCISIFFSKGLLHKSLGLGFAFIPLTFYFNTRPEH